MVVNIEDSIALTHNYVSLSNLSDCLRFLREKNDQVSGVRDRKEAVQPEEIYQEFIHKLHYVLPKDCLDKEIDKSFLKSSIDDCSKLLKLSSRPNSKIPKKRKLLHNSLLDTLDNNDTSGCSNSNGKKSFSFSFDV